MSKLKKNITYNFLYQILNLILPFITAPYLARVIGAEGVGIYSFAQSIALYFSYFAVLGLNNYGNRSIAEVQNNKKERSKRFWEIYSMQLITSLISILLYLLYLYFFSIDKVASLIMFGWVLASAFDINWLFFGLEQFKLTVIRNTIIKLFSTLTIFIFVKTKNDIYIYISIMVLSNLLSQLALWPYVKRYIVFSRPKWKDIKKHFKPNLVLFIPIILVSVYKIMDKIMLGYLKDTCEVGYYENSEKIITMIESLIVAVGTVMLPRMTENIANNKNYNEIRLFDISMNIVIIYALGVIFGLLAIKDDFVNIYFGSEFKKTASIIGILSITIFFFGIGNVLRTQYLIPHKYDKIYVISAGIGAIINLIMNLILIPFWGGIGAAIATAFSEIAVCLYQFYKVRDKINTRKYYKNIVYYTFISMIMYVIIINIKLKNIILKLFVQVCMGAMIYITLVIIKNNKIIKEYLNNKKEK